MYLKTPPPPLSTRPGRRTYMYMHMYVYMYADGMPRLKLDQEAEKYRAA